MSKVKCKEYIDVLQNFTKGKITLTEIAQILIASGVSKQDDVKKLAGSISNRIYNDGYFSDEEKHVLNNFYKGNGSLSAVRQDRIEIYYWNQLPEELRNPKIVSVWFDKEIIENAWGMSADHLCIVPMVGDKMFNYWYPIRSGDILIIDTSQNHIMGNGVYFATSQNNTRFWVREMQVLINQDIEIKGYSPSGSTIKTFGRKQLEDVDFRLIGKVIKNVSFRL